MAKSREKYEQDCIKINGYTAQSSLVQGRDLEKVNSKLDKAQATVSGNGAWMSLQYVPDLQAEIHVRLCCCHRQRLPEFCEGPQGHNASVEHRMEGLSRSMPRRRRRANGLSERESMELCQCDFSSLCRRRRRLRKGPCRAGVLRIVQGCSSLYSAFGHGICHTRSSRIHQLRQRSATPSTAVVSHGQLPSDDYKIPKLHAYCTASYIADSNLVEPTGSGDDE